MAWLRSPSPAWTPVCPPQHTENWEFWACLRLHRLVRILVLTPVLTTVHKGSLERVLYGRVWTKVPGMWARAVLHSTACPPSSLLHQGQSGTDSSAKEKATVDNQAQAWGWPSLPSLSKFLIPALSPDELLLEFLLFYVLTSSFFRR